MIKCTFNCQAQLSKNVYIRVLIANALQAKLSQVEVDDKSMGKALDAAQGGVPGDRRSTDCIISEVPHSVNLAPLPAVRREIKVRQLYWPAAVAPLSFLFRLNSPMVDCCASVIGYHLGSNRAPWRPLALLSRASSWLISQLWVVDCQTVYMTLTLAIILTTLRSTGWKWASKLCCRSSPIT